MGSRLSAIFDSSDAIVTYTTFCKWVRENEAAALKKADAATDESGTHIRASIEKTVADHGTRSLNFLAVSHRQKPEQIVAKLRGAAAMLNAGKDLAVVVQTLEVSEVTYHRWVAQYGGMKSEEAKRLKEFEDENRRLKQLVADQALDIQMLNHVNSKNY